MADAAQIPGLNWPDHAQRFAQSFAAFERALKRARYVKDRPRAEADWADFARDLGSEFFQSVRDSGIAPTMLAEPPRKMMRDGQWRPENPAPIADVTELFVRGVCQVRNNLVHGEKQFMAGEHGSPRADNLVREATAILGRALEAMPRLKEHFQLGRS